jgi:hypothetical protein
MGPVLCSAKGIAPINPSAPAFLYCRYAASSIAYRHTETVIKSTNAMHMKKDDHPSEHYWSLQTENAATAPEPN